MATERELRILAAGAMAEVGDLSAEEREKVLQEAFYEGQEEDPAGFLGLDFEKWRQDAEMALYKGICTSDDVLKKLMDAAGLGETDAIKYVTGLAVALVTPYGWLAALLAAVVVPFVLKHIREDLCAAWKKRLKELGWLIE
jgi:hypothetical protein